MSLEETKSLLREHRIVPNKLMGQNFLVDSSIYPKLSLYAELNGADNVLDAGAGFGFFARFLAAKCKGVVAVEKDPAVSQVLREQVKHLPNVTVVEGDILKASLPPFNKVVSFPPYYLSSHLVTWLLDQDLACAVLIVQKEFADRLVAEVGSEQYGWLTVVTFHALHAELLDDIPKWMFHPQPEVESIIVRLKPWETPPFAVKDMALFRRLAKWLFTQRNKKLENALEPFIRQESKMDKGKASEVAASLPMLGKRVRELSPKEFGAVSDALSQ